MYVRNLEDFFGDDMSRPAFHAPNLSDLDADLTINDGPPGSVMPGHLDGTEDGDPSEGQGFVVNLTAGVMYSWAQRPTAIDGIEDPLMLLYGPGGNFITYDDDGGAGRSSLLTYTPTVSGNYTIVGGSWVNLDSTGGDSGDFNIYQWDATTPDTGANTATAFGITTGTTFGHLTTSADIDMYKIDLDAGLLYTFGFSGGYDGAGEPGVIAQLQLYDSAGNVLKSSLAAESGVSFFAQADGEYYVKLTPYTPVAAGKGGYTLDVAAVDPSDYDPLEAFNWDSADNIDTVTVDGVEVAYVYFTPAGENFGEKEPNGVTPMNTQGWQPHQAAAVMHALTTQYTPITGIEYRVTTDVNQAEFRMLTTFQASGTPGAYGARFYPQAPNYGTQQGIGTFNTNSGGFGADPNSLLPGGFAYGVILHEFGHAHGVAHPHDNGGGSEIMLGVTGSTGSFGVYDLNQGVYTVMSYNDGWNTHPDGDRNYSAANRASGWSETLGAFDIAVLQARYGVHDHNVGNNVYTIADTQAEASYQTIWDTGGSDTIAYSGARDANIDLLAATLDYSPTGGGAISFVRGVWGGYTIADGVVVENATGGSGNDMLIGNAAANVLTGNAGNDTLLGRIGDDTLLGGAGDDILGGGAGKNFLTGGSGADDFVFDASSTKDQILDFDSGSDQIDLRLLADVDAGDVKITNDSIFVNTDGDKHWELHIVYAGERVQMSDILFATPVAPAMAANEQLV